MSEAREGKKCRNRERGEEFIKGLFCGVKWEVEYQRGFALKKSLEQC